MFPGKQKNKVKSNRKSVFRRINDWLHLWMGLTSGLVVFIVSITGCIYVFEKDIRQYTQRYQFVEPQDKPFLPPSQLKSMAAAYAFGHKADSMATLLQSITYGGKNKAAWVTYNDPQKGLALMYMDPYDGKLLHTKLIRRDFFRVILEGHFYLWLPHKIGQPVVAVSILIFVLLLISGMVMWWPKNLKKANVQKSFKIKWKASFKRVNYDLHNVLGFYVMAVALVIAITGLVWGFEWWAKSYYWVSSGGKSLPAFKKPFSDTTATASYRNPEDLVWLRMWREHYQETGTLQIQFPMKTSDPVGVIYNPDDGTYYRRGFRYFDRHTLQELKGGGGIYAQPYAQASAADKLHRMNYDIHVGAILGWPGKILAFFTSLICASLPITGFLVWWGKKKKQRKAVLPAKAVLRKEELVVSV
jgi:uncharacterized iron-regulated membrane protein